MLRNILELKYFPNMYLHSIIQFIRNKMKEQLKFKYHAYIKFQLVRFLGMPKFSSKNVNDVPVSKF